MVPGAGRFYAQHAQIIMFGGGTVAAMHKMRIHDDGAISIGDGACRMLYLLAGAEIAIPGFGHLHLTEAQEHLYLDKERKRFRALALKMLEAGEIPAVPECLEHANTRAQFTLIPETFGDLLSEAAQLVTWMCNLSLPLKELGRHAGKYAEGEKTERKGGFSMAKKGPTIRKHLVLQKVSVAIEALGM